jgi:hypothetical protein
LVLKTVAILAICSIRKTQSTGYQVSERVPELRLCILIIGSHNVRTSSVITALVVKSLLRNG